jgi:phosphoribosylformylglycinamidine (FGAM) synthase PurS component
MTVAIKLKIPDNTAYSALTALKRLGVAIDRVERADIWQFEGKHSNEELAASVKRNETLFNPNKHVLELRDSAKPDAGETWVEEIAPVRVEAAAKHYIAWRLFDASGTPANEATVREAAEKLLCNPAIERAIF